MVAAIIPLERAIDSVEIQTHLSPELTSEIRCLSISQKYDKTPLANNSGFHSPHDGLDKDSCEPYNPESLTRISQRRSSAGFQPAYYWMQDKKRYVTIQKLSVKYSKKLFYMDLSICNGLSRPFRNFGYFLFQLIRDTSTEAALSGNFTVQRYS